MDLTALMPTPISNIVLVILAIIAVYFAWRSGKNKLNSEIVQNYKDVTSSQESRICQLEKDFASAKKENSDLRSRVDQLTGENNTLKQMLTYQDPSFKKTIEGMLQAIKQTAETQKDLHLEFIEHAKQDDKRFTDLHKSQTEILQAVIDNRYFYAKTIKALK